jgi:hypothetical protein
MDQLEDTADFANTEEKKEDFISSLMSALGPSEAYGFPIGQALKAGTKKALRSEASKVLKSQAEEVLVGKPFQGRVITKVTKGSSQWRNIHLDDDTIVPVTKDVIADMARAQGTHEYISGLTTLPTRSARLAQSINSLRYHLSRSQPTQTRSTLKDYYKRYKSQLEATGTPVPKMSIVKYRTKELMMPTEYADVLERERYENFKIIERMK